MMLDVSASGIILERTHPSNPCHANNYLTRWTPLQYRSLKGLWPASRTHRFVYCTIIEEYQWPATGRHHWTQRLMSSRVYLILYYVVTSSVT